MEIESKTIIADPRSEVRWDNINDTDPTDIFPLQPEPEKKSMENNPEKTIDNNQVITEADNIQVITEAVNNIKLSSTLQCPECGAKYEKEGYLKKHIGEKHGEGKIDPICKECGKLLSCNQALTRHMKTHMKCKSCNKTFDSIDEARTHIKQHTTCPICKYDYKTKFKIHMKDINKITDL